jgi:hypothetical protein
MKNKSGMKLFLCTLLATTAMVAAPQSRADVTVTKLSSSLKYTDLTPLSGDVDQGYAQSFAVALALRLQDQGMLVVQFNHQDGTDANALSGLDAIFTDGNSEHTAFLKFGLTVSDPNVNGKLLTFKGGYLYHQQTKGGLPYALYIRGFEKSEAIKLIQTAQLAANAPKIDHFKLAELMNLLIPSAMAGAAVPCTPQNTVTNPVQGVFNGIKDSVTHTFGWGCLVNGVGGVAKQSTVGMVKSGWNAIQNGHFTEAVASAWGKVQTSWANLQKLKLPAQEALSKMGFAGEKQFDQLPPETQGELLCGLYANLDGAVIGAILAPVGAAGAIYGTAKLAQAMNAAIDKMQMDSKFASYFSKVKRGVAATAIAAGAVAAPALAHADVAAHDASTAVKTEAQASHALNAENAANKTLTAAKANRAPASANEAISASIAQHPDLNKALQSAGVAEHEQVLGAVAKAAKGEPLSTADAFSLNQAVIKMKPQEAQKFFADAQKVADKNGAVDHKAMSVLYDKQKAIAEIRIDPTNPFNATLVKLRDTKQVTPQDEVEISELIRSKTQDEHIPQAKVEEAFTEASNSCALPLKE